MDDLRFVIGVDDRDLIRSQKEQKKYERNILIIEQALRKNQITSSRYASELNKQASSLSKLGGTYDKANSEVRTYAASVRKLTDEQLRMAQVTNMAGKSTNRFGMYAQQVGYQVGDFFVQVQSGTSALVAFGQQGTQLAGLLPGLTGAVIGISLAVGTMLLRSFNEASGEAATLEEAIEKASDALSDYNDAIDEIVSSPVNSQLSETARHFIEIEQAASSIAKIEIFKGLEQAADKMEITAGFFEKKYDLFKSALSNLDKFFGVGEYKGSAQGAKTPEELTKSLDLESLGLSKNVSVEVYEGFISGLKDATKDQDARKAIQILQEMYTLGSKDKSGLKKSGVEFLATIKKQIDILKETVPELMSKGASVAGGRGQDPKSFTDRYSASFKLEAELSKERVKAQKESDAAFEKQLKKLIATENKQNAIVEKVRLQYIETANLFGLEGKQLLLAQQRMEVTALEKKLIDSGIEKDSHRYKVAMLALNLTQALKLETYEQIEADKKLTEQIRERAKLQDQINKDVLKATKEIEKEQKKFADGIANSFGDAFTSMVDGTKSVKDAFRDMARDIISQLYQVLVVEQMVQSISGAIQGAMGGGMSSPAPQIRPFADGGVVNSPTTFPMSGGRTGLMGEAGPEAIMPLKRGANGKLGVQMEGGGATTVVQNFNFSANGDDSVKRIIAQAAPKIAQMTKSEIINDRRRGGTMKATFG